MGKRKHSKDGLPVKAVNLGEGYVKTRFVPAASTVEEFTSGVKLRLSEDKLAAADGSQLYVATPMRDRDLTRIRRDGLGTARVLCISDAPKSSAAADGPSNLPEATRTGPGSRSGRVVGPLRPLVKQIVSVGGNAIDHVETMILMEGMVRHLVVNAAHADVEGEVERIMSSLLPPGSIASEPGPSTATSIPDGEQVRTQLRKKVRDVIETVRNMVHVSARDLDPESSDRPRLPAWMKSKSADALQMHVRMMVQEHKFNAKMDSMEHKIGAMCEKMGPMLEILQRLDSAAANSAAAGVQKREKK